MHDHKAVFSRDGGKLALKCHNQRLPLNLARKEKKRRELKSYFDNKFEDINEKFSVETKDLAKRIKKQEFHPLIIKVTEFNMSSI